jgi:uncharacterized repeat protein (TIGR03837 family)
MSTPHQRRWDIFCRVIDNFGDIGVSWRLARQLAAEHGQTVRLWVDHMSSLHALCPRVNPAASRQVAEGVEIFQFADESGFSRPADVVIESFGCGLPEHYVSAMAAVRGNTAPLWIVLEYLSAEQWVREHHEMPSPHPSLNLRRYFFFPGFTEGTGGVLREADLLRRRDAFDARARQVWWSRMGFTDPAPGAITLSLFAYPHAPYRDLLNACAGGAAPVAAAVPEGPLATQVRADFQSGRGNLELRYLPFVPQPDYDELLWACDINFVRGEDSFVRAQWARRPFVWHIYPQAERAHEVKLGAFLDLYGGHFPAPAAQAVRGLWRAWNAVEGAPSAGDAWQAFSIQFQALRQGLPSWEANLARAGDVAGNLVRFCQKMI